MYVQQLIHIFNLNIKLEGYYFPFKFDLLLNLTFIFLFLDIC